LTQTLHTSQCLRSASARCAAAAASALASSSSRRAASSIAFAFRFSFLRAFLTRSAAALATALHLLKAMFERTHHPFLPTTKSRMSRMLRC